jgi:hypothetical protein
MFSTTAAATESDLTSGYQAKRPRTVAGAPQVSDVSLLSSAEDVAACFDDYFSSQALSPLGDLADLRAESEAGAELFSRSFLDEEPGKEADLFSQSLFAEVKREYINPAPVSELSAVSLFAQKNDSIDREQPLLLPNKMIKPCEAIQQMRHGDYYSLGCDFDFFETLVTLNVEGEAMLVDYYRQKHQIEITLLKPSLLLDENLIEQVVIAARKQTGEVRHAFILNRDGSHSVIFVYLKTDKHEGVLYADSFFTSVYFDVESLFSKLGITIYLVAERRQADGVSCHTDALVFARDATRIDYLPDLLAKLMARASDTTATHIKTVLLPDQLLKTAQISNFYKIHQQDEKKSIVNAKNETLAMFRARYSQAVTYKKNDMVFFKEHLSTYLRKKGFKLADKIEVQYYLQELKRVRPEVITAEIEADFQQKAKQELRTQGYVLVEKNRKGLFPFTCNYLTALLTAKPLIAANTGQVAVVEAPTAHVL